MGRLVNQLVSEVPLLSCGENDAGRSSCGPTQYAIRRYIFLVEKPGCPIFVNRLTLIACLYTKTMRHFVRFNDKTEYGKEKFRESRSKDPHATK